ncbi:MAG: HAMP domain-containing histidine kinase, partial [Gammaproteobacteria bacterium]|nr:HAMP domain-containing histidine kinase [Gammaproteobacteria bacterium]
ESAELLSEGVTGPLSSHQKEVTDILKKNSIDLQKMIEKLLSFNMPGDDQNKAAWMKLNLREIIETVIADHKPVIIAKKIDLRMQVSDIFILGDEEQFRVVIDNLLSNAVKFTPENGQVVFKARQEGENILIDISDTGPGIDPEEAEDIFEAFYQGNKQGKGLIQGSGLGLSIVREFVQAHQGSIAVINDEHKGGAHFQVKLPSHDKEKDLAWAV